jgi:hypothetical protein
MAHENRLAERTCNAGIRRIDVIIVGICGNDRCRYAHTANLP